MAASKTVLFYLSIILLLSPGHFLTCFTDDCLDATVCVKLCESYSGSCVRVGAIDRSKYPARFLFNQFGCSSNPCNSSHLTCSVDPMRQSCCCSNDYCNNPGGKTDEIADLMKPKFSYRLTPIEPLPTIERGELVCEHYSCSNTECEHYYETCSSCNESMTCLCQSLYTTNATTAKLDLHYKGCLQLPAVTMDTVSTDCLIDFSFTGPLKNGYTCYCNKSLCNVNESITYPTRLSSYGVKECQSYDCEFNCTIVKNSFITCVCPDGFVLNGDQGCTDVNECLIKNGSCHQKCVNTRGSYHCECFVGFQLDPKTLLCVNTSSRFYCSYYADARIRLTDIDESTRISTIDCSEIRTCYTGLLLVRNEWYLNLMTCGLILATPNPRIFYDFYCNTSYCFVQESKLLFGQYECCCFQQYCNNYSRIYFEPPVFSSRISPTTSTKAYSTSTVISYDPVFIGLWSTIGSGFLIAILTVCALCIIPTIFYLRYKGALKGTIKSIKDTSQQLDSNVVYSHQYVTVRQTKNNQIVITYSEEYPALSQWMNERDIYRTREINHDSILSLLSATSIKGIGHQLVLRGSVTCCLHNYLQLHLPTVIEAVKIAHSMTSGISHLHYMKSESLQNTIITIAHCNLNNRNILMKEDGTAVISDFSMSVKFVGGTIEVGADNQLVGNNIRYLSPEVLQGYQSHTIICLTSSDVYSLGLCLWELLNCCKITGNAYTPPFNEVSDDELSMDVMKSIVIEQEKLPKLPEVYNKRREFFHIRNLVDDCFDLELEARPNVHVIEEAFFEMLNKLNAKKPTQEPPSPVREHEVAAVLALTEPPCQELPSGEAMISLQELLPTQQSAIRRSPTANIIVEAEVHM